ncbi:MAG: GNAT family N-acetyltransferase [Alphaproteobacteria bacterium]
MSLKTERLLLRKLDPDDADALAALANDWDVVKWLARLPYPYTRDDAVGFIDFVLAEDLPAWAIVTDRLIGIVGTEDHLGYWLGKAHWGNGYATEAATAALDWHFGNAANTEIVSGHFEGNAASRHVLEKLGFVETGLSMTPSASHGKDVPHVDMLLTRETWVASH